MPGERILFVNGTVFDGSGETAFRADVVLSSNAPLIVQRALLQTAHAHGGRFVFWQQDVISAAARRVVGRRSRLVGATAERAVAVSVAALSDFFWSQAARATSGTSTRTFRKRMVSPDLEAVL